MRSMTSIRYCAIAIAMVMVMCLCGLLPSAASAAQTAPSAPAAEPDDPAQRPKWEAGLVTGAGRVVDYPGADQSHWRGFAAPLFIYRGPILRVDQDGIRGRLLKTSDIEFDVTGSAAFSARNNDARQGMPPLDYLFGVGPQVIYKGLRKMPGGPDVHLNLRALVSTDFHRTHGRGAEFTPEMRWRFSPVAGLPAAFTVSLQPTWADRTLARYFYQVDPSQATPTRPAYDARSGYLGTALNLTLSRRHSQSLSWFATVRSMSLHGAANAASPLLRDKTNVSVGAGLLWTPWQSQARASE
ncbi:MAG: MipA/OmpV family protein [Betaproteobacteria bacterium]|nr:MAG: MipA/OmpV family protein [Betaproteobacteria bacterium]